MSVLSKAHFHDEEAAFKKVEELLWPEGPVCPFCGGKDRIYVLEGVRSKPSKKNPEGVVRHGLKKCGHCRKQFTVRVKTIFESSHIPLHKWLQAIHLLCASKKGISSHQLHRVLEITYEAAWFMSHRIREAMRSGSLAPMGGPGSIVEADETFIGKKEGAVKHPNARGYAHKQAALSLIERGGEVRSFVIDKADTANIKPIIDANLRKESMLMTDEAALYGKIGKEFKHHFTVEHGKDEYVRGSVHVNTLEGYFSIFKRGMKGVYQHCDEKHLHRYLAEFDFRYNNRVANGIGDEERAQKALQGVKGKRLKYERTNAPA
ncbi:IS1595 family transposase [Rhodomicrobium vannielii ATCC 17100]|uniref:IS1595 family transposase n=1 Tax=Rhodomicrobium vannielii TaxID=1069 RepID=UPI0019198035|nr:IS1595 family transposase [Rhodomicrobium vannielii]MBJ7532630.1 IS1595 family transposase [Rhodomicrobium vannielii ATCC 17100]